jgi:hypothetical protein
MHTLPHPTPTVKFRTPNRYDKHLGANPNHILGGLGNATLCVYGPDIDVRAGVAS